MARAMVAVVSVLFLSVGGCFGPPTPEQMKQMVIGEWAANTSAMANLGRAMKLGSQNPGASPSEVTAAARAMGYVALEFREDGNVTAAFQTHVFEGTWKFDPENTMIEMDLTQVPPLAEGQTEPSKMAWVSILDPEKEKMELFLFNREAYLFFQTMDEKTKKNAVIFRLDKKTQWFPSTAQPETPLLFTQMQPPILLHWISQSPYSLSLLVMSAAMAILGVMLCIRPHRTASIALALASFLPGLISVGLVLWASGRYTAIARSPAAPSPTAIAEVIGLAFSASLIGLLATMIPLLIAIVALIRSTSASGNLPRQNDHPQRLVRGNLLRIFHVARPLSAAAGVYYWWVHLNAKSVISRDVS